jgi:hypothetical protein
LTLAGRWLRVLLALGPALGLGLGLGLAVASSAPAQTEPSLATAAATAPDAAGLAKVSRELKASLPPDAGDTTATELESAASTYGALVARAQELAMPAAIFTELAALGEHLEERVTARRERQENDAGEDEALLDALYRSDAWHSLSGSRVEVSFWLGWAQLTRVQRGLDAAERESALAGAERAFARGARALAFPDRALRSTLGLGIVRREQGDLEGARKSLERLQAQRAIRSDPALMNLVRFELALTAIDALDLARGRQLAEELASSGALTPEQQRALDAREVRAWLRISREEVEPQAKEMAAEKAAEKLRVLLGRGGRDTDVAVAIVAQFADDLVGRDLGPIGALLAADHAYQAGDCVRALPSYAAALAEPLPAGVDTARARLRVASCKARAGRGDEAMEDLDALLEAHLTPDQRRDAARLLHSLAESSARATQRPADVERANRAARLLLSLAPESEGADLAHYRRARDLARQGQTRAALAELSKIPPESAAYPAALLERIRLQAERLDRRSAKELAASLDEAGALRESGALAEDPEQEATLATMRARAALLAGEDLTAVEAWIAQARAHERLTEAARQELVSLEIRALAGAGAASRVTALLEDRNDAQLAAELRAWEAALPALESSASMRGALPEILARLLQVAPASSRVDLRLGRIDALRRAGRDPEAVSEARQLASDEPESGDAWLALARGLDALGSEEARDESREVWRRIASSAVAGSASWWEARLSLAEEAFANEKPKKGCRWLEPTGDLAPAPGFESRVERARAQCKTR